MSSAATATKKERRVFRKQQLSNFELVRESKIIWEYLRPHKAAESKVLAQEEIKAFAKGHFKEVRGREGGREGGGGGREGG